MSFQRAPYILMRRSGPFRRSTTARRQTREYVRLHNINTAVYRVAQWYTTALTLPLPPPSPKDRRTPIYDYAPAVYARIRVATSLIPIHDFSSCV